LTAAPDRSHELAVGTDHRGAQVVHPPALVGVELQAEEVAELADFGGRGFSTHIGDAIPFEDKKAIENVACYFVRSPSSLKKLVYLDGQKAVLYRLGRRARKRRGGPRP